MPGNILESAECTASATMSCKARCGAAYPPPRYLAGGRVGGWKEEALSGRTVILSLLSARLLNWTFLVTQSLSQTPGKSGVSSIAEGPTFIISGTWRLWLAVAITGSLLCGGTMAPDALVNNSLINPPGKALSP